MSLIVLIVVLVVLALPVKLGAHLLGAEYTSIGRSMGVLLPAGVVGSPIGRFLLSACVMTLVCTVVLGLRTMKSLPLALVLSTVYSLGMTADGTLSLGLGH